MLVGHCRYVDLLSPDRVSRRRSDHQRALVELGYQLQRQLPAEFVCLPKVEVVTQEGWPATVRCPDLVVVPRPVAALGPPRYQATEVALAVEVASSGSRERDHVQKLYEYSEAAIPAYWVLDLDHHVTLTAYRLIDGEYELVGRTDGAIELTEPAPLSLDVAALLPGR